MCIFCYYDMCLPEFSIYFEYRNRTDHSETIGNFITKTREDGRVLFSYRSYSNHNLVEEHHRSLHPEAIFSNMTAEGMPMWERTRIVVSSYYGIGSTIVNHNFTFRETIDWLAQILRPHSEVYYWRFRKEFYDAKCDYLDDQ